MCFYSILGPSPGAYRVCTDPACSPVRAACAAAQGGHSTQLRGEPEAGRSRIGGVQDEQEQAGGPGQEWGRQVGDVVTQGSKMSRFMLAKPGESEGRCITNDLDWTLRRKVAGS